VIRALRSAGAVLDRVSSRLLGLDGAVRNVRGQLDDRTLAHARVAALERRLALGTTAADPVAA
jgi:hypothetical protein